MSIPCEEAYVRGGMGDAKHSQRTASKLHFRGQGSQTKSRRSSTGAQEAKSVPTEGSTSAKTRRTEESVMHLPTGKRFLRVWMQRTRWGCGGVRAG